MSDQFNISSPWVAYVRKIKALFNEDPDIAFDYDNETVSLRLYVDNHIKAYALDKLLPKEKIFGNVTLSIEVVTIDESEMSVATLINNAFTGNPAYVGMEVIDGSLSPAANFAIFSDKVVHYFDDNLGNYYGVDSVLYEDLAREIFEDVDHTGVFFNTFCKGNIVRD